MRAPLVRICSAQEFSHAGSRGCSVVNNVRGVLDDHWKLVFEGVWGLTAQTFAQSAFVANYD